MVQSLSEDTMYEALLNRDTQFEGQFIVGVKTTGIFCRPSCRARKPKRENVVFYEDSKAALADGYRPCKICRPMEELDSTPPEITELLRELEAQPEQKITAWQLRQRGIDPSRLRRWFKRHHGMTFVAYQRMLRINLAFRNIRKGDKVIEAAYDSGFHSLSGFQSAFQQATRFKPSESHQQNCLSLTRLTTPLGPMFAVASDQGLCLLEFTDRRMLETEFKDLERRLKAPILPGPHPLFETLETQLKAYFAGERQGFDLPLHTPGTDFQQQVWQELQRIPYGNTRSYAEQAKRIGNPKAVRAVARANGCNRIAIIIPCHRVIGSNGQLTGYAGGLHRKQWLLEHEGGI